MKISINPDVKKNFWLEKFLIVIVRLIILVFNHLSERFDVSISLISKLLLYG